MNEAVFQVSFKFGEHQQAMLNVRGDDEKGFADALEVARSFAGVIASLETELRAVSVVGQSFPGTTVMGTPGDTGGYSVNNPPTTPAPGPEYTRCAHGNRVRKDGTSPKGYWAGWFCPLPKGDPNACAVTWEPKK